ncbi:MAG: MFS transporter, partial [Alphaproteobacteria bacterium]
MSETAPLQWIGAKPGRLAFSAAMFVGVSGIMIAGLQPLLLGALESEGRISASQLGHAATAELLTMGFAAFGAGAALKTANMRVIAIVASLILAAIDLVTPLFKGEMVTLVRGAAGLPSGIQMWVTLTLVARTPHPERWSGFYLTVQTLAQFLMATFLSIFVVQTWGANGGFVGLSVFCVVAALAAFFIPDSLAQLPKTESGGSLPGIRGWAALLAAFLYSAFTIGVWVYAEPLSKQAGNDPSTVGIAVSVSLACQVAGGAAATWLSTKWNWLATILGCTVAGIAVLIGFASMPPAWGFIALSGAFGFLWLFVLPFAVPMMIEADPTRRAAVLGGGAQVLGGSFAPFVASFLVTDTDARGALAFGGVCLLASALIAFGLHQTRVRPALQPAGTG